MDNANKKGYETKQTKQKIIIMMNICVGRVLDRRRMYALNACIIDRASIAERAPCWIKGGPHCPNSTSSGLQRTHSCSHAAPVANAKVTINPFLNKKKSTVVLYSLIRVENAS